MGGVRTVVEDETTPDSEYTLVVAVANPNHVDQLLRTAVDVAGANDGEILVVTVAHKPTNSPFLLFSEEHIKREFADTHWAVLDRAVAAVEDTDVPIRRSMLVGADVGDAILSAVREAGAEAILLGWHDRPRPADIVLGRTVDSVVRRAPCDVFVERVGTTADAMESILVPTVGGPHVEPVADLVAAVAAANHASVTAASFTPPDADDERWAHARKQVEYLAERLHPLAIETTVEEAKDVQAAIVDEAAAHDFVVLGATRERRFRNRVVGSVARTVAREADPPVVIAKRGTGESLLDRLFKHWGL